MMNIVTCKHEWIKILNSLKNERIGFVPTMGNLHAGHFSLCHRAKQENDKVVVSIFVNPTQFDEQCDYNSYPRTLAEDQVVLNDAQVDYLFCPEYATLYPDEYSVQVIETELSTVMEGASRPGHFTGMLTVVLKLLNLIRPDRAYFGEKDYQQYLLIKKMVEAFMLTVDIVVCPTKRADDGLALSSRNSRLTPSQRVLAAEFPKYLHSSLSDDEIVIRLRELGFQIDYIKTCWGRRFAAVYIDQVRLIDNIELKTGE